MIPQNYLQQMQYYRLHAASQYRNAYVNPNRTPYSALAEFRNIQHGYDRAPYFPGHHHPYHHGVPHHHHHFGPCGCCQPPRPELSGAPAGKGLTKNADGSITTAGGYKISAEGKDSAWNITGPDGKPVTRVWGDPHVKEGDGTKWDFTKDSNFRLPDGTIIHCDTTSETGKSVTQALRVMNGADAVSINGINGKNPTTGAISHTGFEERARLTGDNYHLGGSDGKIAWYKEQNGRMQGEVTGAYYDKNTKRYEQRVNSNSEYFVDPSMRPPVGTDAWGNELRGDLVDHARRNRDLWGWDQAYVDNIARRMHRDNDFNMMFGGYAPFGGWDQQSGSVGNMTDFMRALEAAEARAKAQRYYGVYA